MSDSAQKMTWLLVTLIVPGCFAPGLRGTVTDVRGDALPGVVVQIAETDRQALTDARGHYGLWPRADTFTLEFSKSGYAPAQLELSQGARTGDIQLWKLPVHDGVYLADANRYTPMTWVIPGQFFMADGTIAFGTRGYPEPATSSAQPIILCFQTPRYDARLTRLVAAEAKQPASESGAFEVWTAGGTVDADLAPVDQPAGMLRRLRIDQPLEPGAYAVHWGSLEGYDTLDTRMFMFEVVAEQDTPADIRLDESDAAISVTVDVQPEAQEAPEPTPEEPLKLNAPEENDTVSASTLGGGTP